MEDESIFKICPICKKVLSKKELDSGKHYCWNYPPASLGLWD